MFLYIDTTTTIQYGILDEKFNWVDFRIIDSKKSSAELHFLMYEINEKNNLKLNDVKKIFYGAGPGSYTGMRVSEGVVNILDWQGHDFNSFYHFDIPFLCGHGAGVWVAKAFKGEYFVYEWNMDRSDKKLLSENDFKEFLRLNKETIFANDVFLANEQFINTNNLIHENGTLVFSKIDESNEKKELFYYRPLAMEFKKAR